MPSPSPTPHPLRFAAGLALALTLTVAGLALLPRHSDAQPPAGGELGPVEQSALATIEEGRRIFRFDTLGSQRFFGRTIRLHRAINEVSPATALAVGLKVDSEALPPEVAAALLDGSLDLDDPANTIALIRLNAVLGVVDTGGGGGRLKSVGITCALCHSTVDDSVAPGVGRRLDGWANRDLNVGAILGLAPRLGPLAGLLGVDVETVRAVLGSWGPGRFDAHLNLDGKAFRPDGKTAAVLIPPAFGLAGVNLHTYTGWGGVPYWNAFVGTLEMNGSGRFFDPRLDDAEKFPIAARAGFSRVRRADRITEKLAPLHFYQLALEAPAPPEGSFDAQAARRGRRVFRRKARCARCHVPPLYTDPGWNMHSAEEIGIDDFQAMRSPDEAYRTTPLRGLWTHTSGGFYHDGRFATLTDLIDHYDAYFDLGLSGRDKSDLEQFLLSL